MEFSKLVPQIFFDAIARIVPGAVLLVGWAIAVNHPLSMGLLIPFGLFSGLGSSSVFFVFTFLGASYVAGHLISPLSEVLEMGVNRIFRKKLNLIHNLVSDTEPNWHYPPPVSQFFSNAAEFHVGEPLEESTEGKAIEQRLRFNTSLLYIWLDWLRLNDPTMGSRLVKIRAEVKMQSQIAVAAGSVPLIHYLAVNIRDSLSCDLAIVTGALVVTFLAIANYWRLYRIFQFSIINHCYAFHFKEQDFANPKLVTNRA